MARVTTVSMTRLLMALAAAISLVSCQSNVGSPTVHAGGEQLRGAYFENGVRAFLGIPYAAAPEGELRWRPPQPRAPRPGPQEATQFGPACPQDQGNPDWYRTVAIAMGNNGDIVPPLSNISEDCLVLNVWAPPGTVRQSTPWPVMVWIHGGSNVNGFAHEPNYQGHALAAGGVIVVSINYRLGFLGFFAHPALGENGSGRQGLLDQVAALQWVRTNIAAFGGDPTRVTVFGESAGGTNIQALMHLREAQGLFHRAIIQSGSLDQDSFSTHDDAAALAVRTFNADVSAQTLRDIPWEQIVQRQAAELPGHFYAPVVEAPRSAVVPLMIGSNRDEWRMYLSDDVEADYRQAMAAIAPERRLGVDAYLQSVSNDPKRRADYLKSAPGFLCPTQRLANAARNAGQSAFVYLFTRVRPGAHDLGAYHGAEIPYAFDTADAWLPADAADMALTQTMRRYWINFAATGDPNGEDLPYWPAWSATPQLLELGSETRQIESLHTFALCALTEGSD